MVERNDVAAIRQMERRLRKLMLFPDNTDPCSRHVRIMAECLGKDKPYFMFEDERQHCAVSLYATLVALYEARVELHRLTGEYWPKAARQRSKKALERLRTALEPTKEEAT